MTAKEVRELEPIQPNVQRIVDNNSIEEIHKMIALARVTSNRALLLEKKVLSDEIKNQLQLEGFHVGETTIRPKLTHISTAIFWDEELLIMDHLEYDFDKKFTNYNHIKIN